MKAAAMKQMAIRFRLAARRWTRQHHRITSALKWLMITSACFGGSFGFFLGITSPQAGYNPHAFAIGISALFTIACVAIAFQNIRIRFIKRAMGKMARQVETLSDRNWELAEGETRARALVEAQGDLVVLRDANGLITFANDAFCALVQMPRAQLIGSAILPAVMAQGEIAVSSDGTKMHDQQIDGHAGPRWIAWREALVRRDAGHAAEWQSVGRDVTDRAATERALENARDQAHAASLAKSRFLAMASHEIRTPLNGILGMSGLLLDTPLTAEQTTYVRAVKTSGDALSSLIEELLDYSKIEAGRIDLACAPFSLPAMVEDVTELLAPRAHAKGIEIACAIDERLPAMVMGDAPRLRQVLLNLAGNAIKFTPHGGVAIVAEPGIWPGEISLLIRDTGIGIAPEAQARVFAEFEQADEDIARDHGGTGLGLSISERIIKRMGGRMSLTSEIGRGSTFEVAVSLAPAPADLATPPMDAPDLSEKAVMVISAQQIEADLIETRLSRWGASVCLASDLSVAGMLLPERRWHAVLIDAGFGDAGRAFAARATGQTTHRLVMLTPAMRHDGDMIDAADFTGYLMKPIRAASLAAQLLADRDGVSHATLERDDAPSIVAACAGPGLAILVAEDNEINALLMRSLLTKLGHRVVVAGNGEQAYESWLMAQTAATPYDAVLMDVQMPVQGGLETARRIRAAEAGRHGRRTPILALTANALVEDRTACFASGMDGFLVKPLDRDKLATALAAIAGATSAVA